MIGRRLVNSFAGCMEEGFRLVRIAGCYGVDNLPGCLFDAGFFSDIFRMALRIRFDTQNGRFNVWQILHPPLQEDLRIEPIRLESLAMAGYRMLPGNQSAISLPMYYSMAIIKKQLKNTGYYFWGGKGEIQDVEGFLPENIWWWYNLKNAAV